MFQKKTGALKIDFCRLNIAKQPLACLKSDL
jgi:hypothetical protein